MADVIRDSFPQLRSNNTNDCILNDQEDEAPKDDDPETSEKNGRLYDKAGKMRKMKHEQATGGGDGLGVNIRSIVIVAVLMLLMMFAVHCTWVTSNAYSSPSIVLASYGNDGSRQILDDFREAYYWLWQVLRDLTLFKAKGVKGQK